MTRMRYFLANDKTTAARFLSAFGSAFLRFALGSLFYRRSGSVRVEAFVAAHVAVGQQSLPRVLPGDDLCRFPGGSESHRRAGARADQLFPVSIAKISASLSHIRQRAGSVNRALPKSPATFIPGV